jgi:hypothetical protein
LIRGSEILLFILGVMFFSGGLGVGAEEGDLMPSLLPKSVLSAARYLIWGLTSLSLLVNWRSAGVRSGAVEFGGGVFLAGHGGDQAKIALIPNPSPFGRRALDSKSLALRERDLG